MRREVGGMLEDGRRAESGGCDEGRAETIEDEDVGLPLTQRRTSEIGRSR